MRKPITLAFFVLLCTCVSAQISVRGQVQDADGAAVSFANVALYRTADSSLAKVETTDDAGLFRIIDVTPGAYDVSVTFLGAPELRRANVQMTSDTDLGVLTMAPAGVDLAEATVTARRALVEVKPDRTVFNVDGTINAVGNTGLDLLRKAPGVTVDNNDNINVLSRSGVLLYVDGRRMPLSGDDLAQYLRNLNAEEIDRIDIITNPGARYEAEGNAGIIDIRLKRPEDEGANGSLSVNGSQGRYFQGSVNGTGNYRNRWMNLYGTLGYGNYSYYNRSDFENYQNGLLLEETMYSAGNNQSYSWRLGSDIRAGEDHTFGFLASGRYNDRTGYTNDVTDINDYAGGTASFDSTLLARSDRRNDRSQNAYNLNYRYAPEGGPLVNVDLDFGRYRNDNLMDQSNRYVTAAGNPLSRLFNYFDTPTDIDIYTAKVDYEREWGPGTFTGGGKFTRVETYNTFLFYEEVPGAEPVRQLDLDRSNQFDYTENVYAGYLSYQGSLSERWQFTAGLRAELTDATGDLTPFREDLREPPVELNYLSLFPNAGITYALNPEAGHTVNLAYGRRINRPDYNVLNPFREQVTQLTYEQGNPYLNPEIVNNLELGYTHAQRYNFKLAYSSTANQITRLLGPDSLDARGFYVTYDNLASQRVFSFNASAPVQVTEAWNLYVNASASHLSNQANYGGDAVVDVKVFTYNFYVQNTVNLPWSVTAELGGYFSGPGVWGGVLRHKAQGALNVGLQRKFLDDRLNVKVSGNDLLYTSGWRGTSEFNGLTSVGSGNWDSRRIAISLSYSFGNQGVKSRNRRTGLDDAAERVGE
ncbi:TonB-dependent receptor domain-containing protein [Lewinella sp. IMCC34183]|uniref:TonB-dependent receptor domain-containing protein n=1 Tax=Lewinella sp. IMCC34183 TaxID=2248762 RepID=UPI000E25845D|nr:TonB-dependent receptor [Lewinella sp. IMCC34183]